VSTIISATNTLLDIQMVLEDKRRTRACFRSRWTLDAREGGDSDTQHSIIRCAIWKKGWVGWSIGGEEEGGLYTQPDRGGQECENFSISELRRAMSLAVKRSKCR
jgi:hypothetical protein